MGLKVSPGALHPRRIVMRSTGAGRRIVIRPSASGGSGGGGVTDHGALTGLGDDDHPQYALADGTRGAFATTAQGDLADTAVQPSALSDAITAHRAATDPHGDRAYTDAQIIASLANFVAGAPGILDTWLEMVTAIQADQTGLAALTTVVAGKLAKASNLSDLADIPTARTNLGLGSAATTAASAYDAAGTAAAAQAAAIAAAATDATTKADAKVADAINDGTTTVAPSQNAVHDALTLKAPLASPTFTGTPAAPTAAQGTNTTQVATTGYVQTETGLMVPKSTVTTKGDLIAATGSGAVARLPVGTDGKSLVADSSQSTGLAYASRLARIRPPTVSSAYQVPFSTFIGVGGVAAGVPKDIITFNGWFVVPVPITITAAQFRYTGGQSTGALIRLGLFSLTAVDGTYTLASLLGDISGAAAGTYQLTGLSIALPAGVYCGGWVHNSTSSITPVQRQWAPLGGSMWHGAEAGMSIVYASATKAFAFGTLTDVTSPTVNYTTSYDGINAGSPITFQWTE